MEPKEDIFLNYAEIPGHLTGKDDNIKSLITQDMSGKLALQSQKGLIELLKHSLRGAKNLFRVKDAFLFFNTEKGQRSILQEGSFKGERILNAIIDLCFEQDNVLIYRKGDNIYNKDHKSSGILPASTICAPLGIEQGNYGVFLLMQPETKEDFSEEDEELLGSFCLTLSTLINYSAIIMDRNFVFSEFMSTFNILMQKTYLFQKYKKSNATLEEVMQVSKLINSSQDLSSLLQSILNSAKKVLNAESSSLLLIDEKKQELYFNIVSGEKEKELKMIRLPLGAGIAGLVAKTGEPLIINDAENDARVYKDVDKMTDFTTRNLLCAPLKVREKIIGVIEVINSVGRSQFSNADLNLFTSFSDHAALAINNRDLIDNLKATNISLERRVRELSTLFELSSLISQTKDENKLLNAALEIISERLGLKRSAILFYDAKKNSLTIISQKGLPEDIARSMDLPFSGTIAEIAFKENRIIRISDIKRSEFSNLQKSGYASDSFMVMPLNVNKEIIGVMTFTDKVDNSEFSEDDENVFITVVNQVLKGYEIILLNKEITKNEILKKELETSKIIQRAILPHKIPNIKNLDLGAVSISAQQVGGDFYDFFNLGQEKLGIVIADVSGKSLPAALFMASTSSIIRTLARDINDPDELLLKANDYVYQNSQSGMFVTLFYIILDLARGKLFYSSAGHNEQILIKKDLDFKFLKARGSPLGILPSDLHKGFSMEQASFEKGDILVLYTDGVIEAINPAKEEFDMTRFIKSLKLNQGKKSAEIIDSIFKVVNEFAGEEPQFDDFTMVIVKF